MSGRGAGGRARSRVALGWWLQPRRRRVSSAGSLGIYMLALRDQGRVPHLGGTAEAICKRLVPNRPILVFYEGDPTWHELLPVWPVGPARWICLTPDDDLYGVSLYDVDPSDGPIELSELTADFEVPDVIDRPVYRFRNYPGHVALKTLLRDGRKAAKEERGAGAELVPPRSLTLSVRW